MIWTHWITFCFQYIEECLKPWPVSLHMKDLSIGFNFSEPRSNFPYLWPTETKSGFQIINTVCKTCNIDICSRGDHLGLPYGLECTHELRTKFSKYLYKDFTIPYQPSRRAGRVPGSTDSASLCCAKGPVGWLSRCHCHRNWPDDLGALRADWRALSWVTHATALSF